MAEVYPIVNLAGATIAVCNQPHNAERLAWRINDTAGVGRVRVADMVALNPKHTDELIDRLIELAAAGATPVGGGSP
jgi:hypothetical protein